MSLPQTPTLAKHDERRFKIQNTVESYFFCPFAILIYEPLFDFVTLYMGLVYSILYLFEA
jgi:hypothetical protein